MASFTETATLLVKDGSTGPIKKINAALKDLFKTAKSLKSVKIDLSVNAKGLVQASAAVKKLNSDLKSLKAASSAVKLSVNTSGISAAQKQINALRQAARAPITVTTRAAAAAGHRAAGLGAGAPRTGVGPFGVHVLSMPAGYAQALAGAIVRSTAVGASQVDVADTKIAVRQLSDEQRRAADVAISQLQEDQRRSGGGTFMNRALTQQLYAEASGVTGGDTTMTTYLVREAQSLAKMGYALGQAYDVASEGALSFIKAGEQMGAFYDKAGKFDPEKAQAFFETQRQAQYQIGKEYTGQKVLTNVSNLGLSKYALSESREGMIKHALMAEEMSSRASVAWNQAINQLTGDTVQKKQLKNLEKAGLLTVEQVKWGATGGKNIMEVVGRNAKNEDELRSNVAGWIMDQIVPFMKQQGMDPTNRVQASKIAAMFTSSARAREGVAAMILRANELENQYRQAIARSGTTETAEAITGKSSRVAAAGVRTEFQSVLGQLVNQLEGATIPTMRYLSQRMSKFADEVATGDVSPTKIAEGVAASATGLSLMGITQGLSAMVTGGPMEKAGGSMLVAGGMMITAAGMQMTAAGVKTATDVAAGAAAGGAAGAAAKGGGRAALGRLLGIGARGAGWLGGAYVAYEEFAPDKVKEGVNAAIAEGLRQGGQAFATPGATAAQIASKAAERTRAQQQERFDRARMTGLEKTAQEIEQARARVAVLERKKAEVEKIAQTRPPKAQMVADYKRWAEEQARLQAYIDAKVDEFKRAYEAPRKLAEGPPEVRIAPDSIRAFGESIPLEKSPFGSQAAWDAAVRAANRAAAQPKPEAQAPPKSFADIVSDRRPMPVYDVREGRPKTEQKAPPFIKQVPLPMADPRKAGFETPPSASIDLLSKANDNFAKTAGLFSTTTDTFKFTAEAVKAASESVTNVLPKLAEVPAWVADFKTTISETPPWLTTFSTSVTDAGAQIASASTTMGTSIAQLPTASASFSSVFDTGASAISNSGATAAASIVSQMPGAGALLGNAAAAAIRAAVSDINISAHVDVTQNKKPDTGNTPP